MTSLHHIEHAIMSLPMVELSEFRRWFAEFDAKYWDDQIEADVACGKLDALVAEAKKDVANNRCSDLRDTSRNT